MQTTCQWDTHVWWSNSSQSLRNWRRTSRVIDTSEVLPSIGPTLAGPGLVLGRFINDTWPAPAGPLYRPIQSRFLRPGRVLGQTRSEHAVSSMGIFIKLLMSKTCGCTVHSSHAPSENWAVSIVKYGDWCSWHLVRTTLFIMCTVQGIRLVRSC